MIRKLDKLIHRVQLLSEYLKDRDHSDAFYLRMDWFQHMENVERLKVVKEQMEETSKRLELLNALVETQCKEVFQAWKKDVRRLNAYNIEKGGCTGW